MKNHLSLLLLILCFPSLVLGQSVDSQFSTPSSMTDQQMIDAQNFTHQGVKDRVVQEGCAKIDNCDPSEKGFPIEMLIGKAYALLGMLSGSGGMMPTLTGKAGAPTQSITGVGGAEKVTTVENPGKPQNDYCMMAAMAYEAVGGMIQGSLQQKADGTATAPGDAQLQSLISLKETHLARKKTATIQSAIYGAVTTCYGAMAAIGKIELDWKYWAKVGGAATLTLLYMKKVKKHSDAAKQVQLVIDSLPKAGDCNPWTGTSCFCSEPTSITLYAAQYQEVCVLNNGNFDVPLVATGCGTLVDNNLQFDKECKCKLTNSCLQSSLRSYMPGLNTGNNLMNEANKGFEMVNSGNFDQGKLDAYAMNAAAMASKMKGKLDPNTIPKKNLTNEEKEMAKALSAYLPPSMANLAAGSESSYKGGINDSAISASVSKLDPAIKEKLGDAIKVGYSQGGRNDSSSSSSKPDFVMPNLSVVQKVDNGTEVLSFAEQAISKADVSNTPQTPIFDIISNRYRRSGWTKLQRFE